MKNFADVMDVPWFTVAVCLMVFDLISIMYRKKAPHSHPTAVKRSDLSARTWNSIQRTTLGNSFLNSGYSSLATFSWAMCVIESSVKRCTRLSLPLSTMVT